MTQVATVKRLLEGQKAEILVVRQSACGHDCQSCSGCGPSAAAQITAVAENSLGAMPGDTVEVESDSAKVLGLAVVVYLVPLVILFAAYFIASGLGLGDGISVGIGLVCAAASFLIAWRLDRRMRGDRSVQMRIVEVLRCSGM